ncbi:MAG TPA: sodium-translocating pyrophosphatase [Spirochaetales bacterium]|nr:sodium-translocating pyrophosphatase [Spirochaetales bacterium]HPG85185.1 sodium-translocating pyrophosphatase [Spirochaetales bacterium]HPM71716.1 sodium-translocating pyrophosphatase [Spirochaetales bacterium]
MNIIAVLLAAAIGGTIAIVYAVAKSRWIRKRSVGDATLERIAGYIAEGAEAFLRREYTVLVPFVALVALFLAVANSGSLRLEALAFVLGALCSAAAGYFGMRTATAANSRTASAASDGIGPALRVAFAGGSVMGMTVVGLALLGIAAVVGLGVALFGASIGALRDTIFPILSGFSLGASTIALFARVGGGIFTKAADVGADLVGKVEAGIPEDDPRNPAVIADNVGDNVGDVAGMGADLFESYVGSIVGCVVLGIGVAASDDMRLRLALLPILMAAMGILASIAGTFLVRGKPGRSPQKSLNAGSFGAAALAAALMYPLARLALGSGTFDGGRNALSVALAAVFGLVSGTAIGLLTEFFTGTNTAPVRKIERSCDTGAATAIITGLGVGMLSTLPPVLVICGAMLGSYSIAGLYGIGMAALGMLVTLGIQLSVDAYGPIADNAGGLAVMSAMDPHVRDVTDELDAVGNTTAAVGKGFAIGSAALTAIILFSAFAQSAGGSNALVFDVTAPKVLVGLLLGGMIPFLFSALSMDAIGASAFAMIEEVRRQFRERPGILEETETPDYRACVDISTKASLRRMILPGVIAAASPVVVGFAGGIEMLGGLLAGVTVTGVLLAIFMSNSGGAWDNAKKLIESRAHGKGSDAHKAAVVGDTVGDPFKDTAGPALNILIKLMAIISLVIAPMLKSYWG